jgi:hypothetical protein
MKERYIPIRPGILEHLLRGDISALEFGVYVMIHLQADFSTGIWRGSAPRILNSAPKGAKLRETQRAIEQLTDLGLLKHFHKHGQRGNFPFLINKFTVRSGALKGSRLNASKSDSWKCPVYESCADDGADDDADDDAQDAPIQEVRSKKKEGKKNRAAKPAALADPRFQPFVDFAFQTFEVKHGQKPAWAGKDFKNLKTLLGKNKTLTLEELQRRWTHYLGSTELFTVKQGGSLAYFCTHFDSFMAGPILKAGPKSAQPIGAPPRNELSAAGRKKIDDYGVVQ